MRILNVTQGSPEWDAHRAKCNTASEAPAMMGADPRVTRSELLRMKATGSEREFSDWVRANLLQRGHEIEALVRPMVEAMIGEDLYPVTATDDDGYLLASFDGLTMGEDSGFECKLWNEKLAAQVRARELDPLYYWQLEQQILVGGLEKVIFACSDGTPQRFESMEYFPVPGRAAQLVAAWRQFDEDRANYQHVEILPPAVGKSLMALPTLSIALTGEITSSNLAEYKATASSFIASINTDLETDEDFATAEKTVTFFDAAEKELEAVKNRALAQTASIDELFRTMDALREEMRTKRLYLNKLVTSRKEAIRAEIRQSGIDRLAAHVAALNKRLGKDYMPVVPADFAGIMKSKRTIASLRDAVDTELARAKLAGNEIADRLQANLDYLRDVAKDHLFLFADTRTIIIKAPDDCAALIKLRITEHEEKERRRVEAERERIRKEEADKLARAELTQTVGHSPAFPFPLPVAPSVTPQQASQVSAVAPVALPATRKESDLLFWVHSIVSDTRIPDDIARTQILNATRPLFAARAA